MADTTVQREVERWLTGTWLPERYDRKFSEKKLPLSSGGEFKFDAVSDDGSIAVTISTSGAFTSGGKRGSGKLQKIRADALFLILARVTTSVMLFTERDMFALCKREHKNGRLPQEFGLLLVDLPLELERRLRESRRRASEEVSPMLQGNRERDAG